MSARRVHGAVVAACALVVLGGCRAPEPAAGDSPSLRQVTLPDLSQMAESVQTQLTGRHASLMTMVTDAGASPGVLGAAYGEMGRLLMAARYHESAEPYFQNAEALQPDDFQWPYLLGHVYQASGDLEESEQAFERAVRLRPDDAAALFWLGDTVLDQDRPEAAVPLFEKARSVRPRFAAAEYGLGRAALAREDYREAVARFEEALALEPQATIVHYPLAMAYRGLGDTAQAEAHLRQRGETLLPLPDSLMAALSEVLNSSQSFEMRSQAAVQARDWDRAAAHLRQAIALAPDDPSPRHGLGAVLAAMGDARGAVRELDLALKLSPRFAGAHYTLGLLLASADRDREAIEHLSAAVESNPDDAQAQLALGDLLRRSGRVAQSLGAYQRALDINARLPQARFGYAIGLVRLGRYREAAEWLGEGMTRHPDRPDFALALARLLAAAPDDRVRDGERALALVRTLAAARAGAGLEVGEAMAMALAELKRYAEATRVQRDVVAAVEKGEPAGVPMELRNNLQRYERGQPCRTPWASDHPIHRPGPPPDAELVKALAGAA